MSILAIDLPLANADRSKRIDPAFLRTLMQLRWFAALGQALAIWVALHWLALPLTAVFTHSGPFKDLYQEKDDDKQRL